MPCLPATPQRVSVHSVCFSNVNVDVASGKVAKMIFYVFEQESGDSPGSSGAEDDLTWLRHTGQGVAVALRPAKKTEVTRAGLLFMIGCANILVQ